MAEIMATMAAKTPNEMLETAIFFFLRYFLKKKLPLEKTIERKFMEIERQREEAENIGKQWC